MSELRILSEPGFSGFSDFQDCTVNIVVQGPYASPFLSESRIILKFQFQTGSIKSASIDVNRKLTPFGFNSKLVRLKV